MSKPKRAVYVATVRRQHKGKTFVSHLLRHTYRENGQVKQLTLGSLTDLPEDLIELIRRRLASDGCPVAVEVFPGNTSDPVTFTAQVKRLRDRFGLRRVNRSSLPRRDRTPRRARTRRSARMTETPCRAFVVC